MALCTSSTGWDRRRHSAATAPARRGTRSARAALDLGPGDYYSAVMQDRDAVRGHRVRAAGAREHLRRLRAHARSGQRAARRRSGAQRQRARRQPRRPGAQVPGPARLDARRRLPVCGDRAGQRHLQRGRCLAHTASAQRRAPGHPRRRLGRRNSDPRASSRHDLHGERRARRRGRLAEPCRRRGNGTDACIKLELVPNPYAPLPLPHVAPAGDEEYTVSVHASP